MKDIVSYKFFKNAEEFENWQIEEDRKIVSVMPSPSEVTETGAAGASFSADVIIGVIVTYLKQIEVS